MSRRLPWSVLGECGAPASGYDNVFERAHIDGPVREPLGQKLADARELGRAQRLDVLNPHRGRDVLERFELFDNQRTLDEHRAWGERLERSVAVARRPRMNDRTSERGQRIDVLDDLAGHDRHDRLDAFARTPAPVQVGRFGHMNTTGLATIDRRFTDVRRVRQARSSAAVKGFGVSRRLPASCPIPGRLRSSGTAM